MSKTDTECSPSRLCYVDMAIMDHERLSKIVAEVLGEFAEIEQADCQVVAYSFESPDDLIAGWEMAKSVAVLVSPWLKHKDASDGDWSMNLFTLDGLWEFPERST